MSNIVNALKVAEASKEAMTSPEVMLVGRELLDIIGNDATNNELLMRALFKYSAILSASCAGRVTEVLLTETQLDGMLSEIKEFDEIERDVLGE